MRWMEEYTLNFDAGNDSPEWYHPDWTLHKADGTIIRGRDVALQALRELYKPLIAHLHEPFFAVCTETQDGWEMIGQARLYGKLGGQPAEGEEKFRDQQGNEWDICVPSAFVFQYVKDEKAENGMGILMKRSEIMTDSGVPMKVMLKRGLMKASDLGL
jgi:hypothetical protein